MYFVYILTSKTNNKHDVGFTSKDPKVRLEEHNSGSNTWTRSNGPFTLIYYETFICEQDARNRELFYKTGIGKKIKSAIVQAMRV